jgi:hypothetical protein
MKNEKWKMENELYYPAHPDFNYRKYMARKVAQRRHFINRML